MLIKLIMFLCHIEYKASSYPIMFIEGNKKDDGKYLLYTENKNVARRMKDF